MRPGLVVPIIVSRCWAGKLGGHFRLETCQHEVQDGQCMSLESEGVSQPSRAAAGSGPLRSSSEATRVGGHRSSSEAAQSVGYVSSGGGQGGAGGAADQPEQWRGPGGGPALQQVRQAGVVHPQTGRGQARHRESGERDNQIRSESACSAWRISPSLQAEAASSPPAGTTHTSLVSAVSAGLTGTVMVSREFYLAYICSILSKPHCDV